MVILRDDSEQHRGSNNPCYGIGDLAREFDTTLRAIRHYEAQGLITPLRNGQVRVYGERDRVRLKLILRGRRVGFSIAEIGDMLALYDAPDGELGQIQFVLTKLRERRRAIEEQRSDIDEMLEQLNVIERRISVTLEHQMGL
jgi:DNA-binding transcriptional MerR regulator